MKKQTLKNIKTTEITLPKFELVIIKPEKGTRIISCKLDNLGKVIVLQDKK